jgi:hypothetical protein
MKFRHKHVHCTSSVTRCACWWSFTCHSDKVTSPTVLEPNPVVSRLSLAIGQISLHVTATMGHVHTAYEKNLIRWRVSQVHLKSGIKVRHDCGKLIKSAGCLTESKPECSCAHVTFNKDVWNGGKHLYTFLTSTMDGGEFHAPTAFTRLKEPQQTQCRYLGHIVKRRICRYRL